MILAKTVAVSRSFMKYCPQCQTNYDDDSYEFCLQDGTVLVELSNSQMPTIALNETETTFRNSQVEPTRPNFQPYQNSAPTHFPPVVPTVQAAAPKSNTAQAVWLTIIGMLALFGAGFGAWFFIGNRQPEVVENINNNSTNSNHSPTPKSSTNSNTNKQTPSPTLKIDSEQIKSEVSSTINDWKAATEAGDINSCLNNYAETIDYYGKQKSRSAVRADKQNAFNKFDSMSISLTNMRITPDANGENATAVFDKEWVFTGEKFYAGKVQSQYQFVKSGNRWLISSEKDLKVYYVRK
ncbi:hypothetical protein BH10ACI1_BH10ACI1_33190 [soil metagenome]